MPQQYVARWSGGRIGAGASVFHFQSIAGPSAASTIAAAVRSLFVNIQGTFPDEVVISFDAEVRELNSLGVMTATYPVTPGANVAGTNTSAWANGTGIVVRHNTGIITGGRRVIGRTFLVPAASNQFGLTGEVLPAAATSINTAFSVLRTSTSGPGADFAVFSKVNGLTAPVLNSVTQSRPSNMQRRNDRL